jgi:hypothetical protein
MDAVQRERRKAKDYGYLSSNAQIIVSDGPYITIVPVHPAYIPVPYYDPAIVFFPPEPGIVIGGAIRFDFFVTIGEFFRPWGWGYCRFDWDSNVVIINNAPWRRTWINRREYVHPYEVRQYRAEERLPERHVLHERTEHERTAAREERHRVEEHRDHRSRYLAFRAESAGCSETSYREGQEGKRKGWERGHLCPRSPFHSDTNSYFDLNLSLIWSRIDYAATLTTIWAKPR